MHDFCYILIQQNRVKLRRRSFNIFFIISTDLKDSGLVAQEIEPGRLGIPVQIPARLHVLLYPHLGLSPSKAILFFGFTFSWILFILLFCYFARSYLE